MKNKLLDHARILMATLLVVITIFSPHLVSAQQATVSGTVLSSDDNDPLPGVSVVIKGTAEGTQTDANGKYTLAVTESQILQFSFIGYTTQEIAVGTQTLINVTLSSDINELDEVVVVGYGSQERKDVTGAISSVDIKTLQSVPLQTADQALQGRVAGVDVQSNSGLPGGGVKINIRGIGTLNSTEPLYVIDGYYPGNINSLNPNDISAIDILKDASASAIYGVLGANGVVIITTKRAKSGKPTITLDSYLGFQEPRKYLEMLNNRDFATVSNNAKDNSLFDENMTAFNSGKPYTIQTIGSSRVPSLKDLENLPKYDAFTATSPDQIGKEINTDWQREIYRTAPTQSHTLTISGGTESARLLTSVGYLSQDGILKGTGFNRLSARMNADVNFKKFTFGASLYFAAEDRLQNAGGRSYGATADATKASPTLAIYNSAPAYIGGFNGNERERDGQDAGNPLKDLIINDKHFKNYLGYVTMFGEYEIIPGLKYKLNLGTDFNLGYNKEFYPVFKSSSYDLRDLASLSERNSRNIGVLIENTLNYEKTVGLHKFSILAGYVARENQYNSFSASKNSFPIGDIIRVADAGLTVTGYGGDQYDNSQVGILGRINYQYNDKYLLTANIRRDGSSRFGNDYRFGVFPSASVGWKISQEEFMQGLTSVSNLKIRAGWGVIGNQDIGDYRYSGVINNFAKYLYGQSTISSGGTISSAVNPEIQWETTTQTNVGIDAGFLNDKFLLTVDYFSKITSDILLETPIPGSTGFDSSPTVNVGEVKNNGVEFSGSYQDQSGDFSWNIGGNISFIKNEVVELNSEKAFVVGNSDNSNDNRPITRTQAGYPIGAFYGFVVEKIYQSNSEVYYDNALDGNSNTAYGGSAIRAGDIKFKDINGDGKIDANDRTFLGSPTPNFVFGLFLRGGYKGFDLQAQFQGVQGSEIYNTTRFWTEGMQRNFNYDSRTLDRYISETNPGNGAVPRANSNDANNSQISNRYIEDGSYLRLKNLSLGYDLGAGLLNNVKGISRLRIYLTASNLLTFTKYTGYDPEIGAGYEADAQKSNRNRNIDNGNYPYAKTFLVGLQIGL